jgi:hypothetical protein
LDIIIVKVFKSASYKTINGGITTGVNKLDKMKGKNYFLSFLANAFLADKLFISGISLTSISNQLITVLPILKMMERCIIKHSR